VSFLPDLPVEVFRSTKEKGCRERALVLQAQSIPHLVSREAGSFAVMVSPTDVERATREIEKYEEENRGWSPRGKAPPLATGHTPATVAFLLLLGIFFFLQSSRVGGLDWLGAGTSHAAAIGDGEIWRAMTSLFLHADLAHLTSNLVYGALLGFLVACAQGGGLGWLTILVAGFLGNLTNAFLMGPDHRSIGASTAVFGAAGVLAGAEWLRRTLLRESRLRIAAPILVGFLLLGYLGMGGAYLDPETLEIRPGNRRTDIAAHVTGMLWGLPLGALLTLVPPRFARHSRFQILCGLTALGLIAVAWTLALTIAE
jgi:rhomboid protease GluP